LIVIHDILGNTSLAQTGLAQLKLAFALFQANKQQYPLYYEGQLVDKQSQSARLLIFWQRHGVV
jgi:endoglucanase Acf2